jgi:hypothetical protein
MKRFAAAAVLLGFLGAASIATKDNTPGGRLTSKAGGTEGMRIDNAAYVHEFVKAGGSAASLPRKHVDSGNAGVASVANLRSVPLAVVGRVEAVTYISDPSNNLGDIPLSRATLKVERVLQAIGADVHSGQSIEIAQNGGPQPLRGPGGVRTGQGVLVEFDVDPLLMRGERVVLFLHKPRLLTAGFTPADWLTAGSGKLDLDAVDKIVHAHSALAPAVLGRTVDEIAADLAP